MKIKIWKWVESGNCKQNTRSSAVQLQQNHEIPLQLKRCKLLRQTLITASSNANNYGTKIFNRKVKPVYFISNPHFDSVVVSVCPASAEACRGVWDPSDVSGRSAGSDEPGHAAMSDFVVGEHRTSHHELPGYCQQSTTRGNMHKDWGKNE